MITDPRQLPQVQAVLASAEVRPLVDRYGHEPVAGAVRDLVGALRRAILAGDAVELPDFATGIRARIEAAERPGQRAVVNATGIIIHTNLGRAPLAPEAVQALQDAAAGASNLELDLRTGKRGSRGDHVQGLIRDLTGAEAALVVNNCAAAVLLALTGLASGRGVIASRGELIEIGGAFRMPDVIVQSGARLVEVGTTNRTRTADYAGAIDESTAVLLKSHTSNFRVVGFTSAPERGDLAALARAKGLVLIEDLGSGVLVDLSRFGLSEEPVVGDVLRAGVDLVLFSGDKLLGGPQAGVIAGRADLVAALKAHPLHRALRIDKLSLAALEATLRLYLPPNDPLDRVPVLRMLAQPAAQVLERARVLARDLARAGVPGVQVVDSLARAGGGTLPQQDLPSHALCLDFPGVTAETLAARLRGAPVPVIGRIRQGRVLLDMRTVTDGETVAIAEALVAAARE